MLLPLMAIPEYEPERDDPRIDVIRSALKEGQRIVDVVEPWGLVEGIRIINLVISDYVADFNKAVAGAQTAAPLDTTRFFRDYDALWQGKLDLSQRA